MLWAPFHNFLKIRYSTSDLSISIHDVLLTPDVTFYYFITEPLHETLKSSRHSMDPSFVGYFNILNPGKLILYFDDVDDGICVLRRRCILMINALCFHLLFSGALTEEKS